MKAFIIGGIIGFAVIIAVFMHVRINSPYEPKYKVGDCVAEEEWSIHYKIITVGNKKYLIKQINSNNISDIFIDYTDINYKKVECK